MNQLRSSLRPSLISASGVIALTAFICLSPNQKPQDEFGTAKEAQLTPASSPASSSPTVSWRRNLVTRTRSKAVDPVAIGSDLLDSFLGAGEGAPITFDLPGGQRARGAIGALGRSVDVPGAGYVHGRLTEPHPGFFFFQRQSRPGKAGEVVGVVRFDEADIAYRVTSSAAGPQLIAQKPDEVYCIELAPLFGEIEEAELPSDHPDDVTIPSYQNGVIPLQSFPGATGVLYLDFDGEDGPHAGWGEFDAASPNRSNAQIRDVWSRVAEDFAPFNLNVTTDLNVYLAAPEESRQRCIITPTDDASPGSGGAAYVGSFDWTGDTPCWAFVSSGKSAAEVISHELGHTLDLAHDGRFSPEEDYFAGHGEGEVGWAPIMGSGSSKNLSQWSKGEYLNANQTQDDLLKIATENNNVGFRADDHGGDFNSASHLNIQPDGSVSSDGVIETTGDIDAFRFSLHAAATVTLDASPAATGPNLDLMAELRDSGGVLLASDNPDLGIGASITLALAPGDYSLEVRGTGRGLLLDDGYSNYGSLGFYTISGTVPNSVLPDRFEIAENSPIDTPIGTVTPRANHGANPLQFSIASGNGSGMFGIDTALGTLTVADPAQFDFEAWTAGYELPEFELAVDIVDTVDGSANESIRVIVSLSNVNEAPTGTSPAPQIAILENTSPGTTVMKIDGHDPDYGDGLTFSIAGGDPGGIFAIDPGTGLITVAGPPSSSTQLTIDVRDSGTPALNDTVLLVVQVVSISGDQMAGSIRQTFFENISGADVSDLTGHPNFPNMPDSDELLSSFEAHRHGDNYGSTIRGYVIPPEDGDYTFWLASDGPGELYFSEDDDPGSAELIISVDEATGARTWLHQSDEFTLDAGEAYYIEVRFKEDTGDDHAAVAWQSESITREVIPGRYLAPFYQNYAPVVPASNLEVYYNSFETKVIGIPPTRDANEGDSITQYELLSGNDDGIFSIDPVTGAISVARFGQLEIGLDYPLVIRVTDSGAPGLSGTGTVTISAIDIGGFAPGGIVQEIWDDVEASGIGALTSDPRYPQHPTRRRILQGFDSGTNTGNEYGSRIRAYFIPPATGSYTFHFCSDDHGSLLLSTDDDPANATEIASVNGWTQRDEWDKYPSQTSSPIQLAAGTRYYIETIQKEDGGADHVQVAWTATGTAPSDYPTITVIDAALLEPFDGNVPPTWDGAPFAFSVDKSASIGDPVGTVTATDSEPVRYAILGGNSNGAFAIDPVSGALTVANPAPLATGQQILTVGAQDDGSGGFYPHATTTTEVTIVITLGGNSAPVALPRSFSIYTNTIPGSVIGEVFAFDQNRGDVLAFSLDTDTTPFSINSSTGRISLDEPLAPGATSVYVIPFTVTDAGGLTGGSTITVNITVPTDSDDDGLLDSWETRYFATVAVTGRNDDPDGDDIDNFTEMSFGTDPTIPDGGDGQETIQMYRSPAGDEMFLVYRRPKNYEDKGLSYTIVKSADMATWESASPQFLLSQDHPDGYSEWIWERIATSGAAIFIRVDVSQNLGGNEGA